jgi:hypothetical protein
MTQENPIYHDEQPPAWDAQEADQSIPVLEEIRKEGKDL